MIYFSNFLFTLPFLLINLKAALQKFTLQRQRKITPGKEVSPKIKNQWQTGRIQERKEIMPRRKAFFQRRSSAQKWKILNNTGRVNCIYLNV